MKWEECERVLDYLRQRGEPVEKSEVVQALGIKWPQADRILAVLRQRNLVELIPKKSLRGHFKWKAK